MVRRTKKMTITTIEAIVVELDKWALGQLGSKLSWAILEDSTGFSRQSLQAKPNIKAAFDNAKDALRGGIVLTKEETINENAKLHTENKRLKLELDAFQEKELLWLTRWQRIAYHIRQKEGWQIGEIDKEIHEGAEKPSKRKTADILRPFDKDIPPSGRV